ncbi:Endoplasmic reticulum oxidoreductin-1 [Hibiscus syriacus]|uniref:Endoplasmic reticulum oxidoreductin-1 n=1 Tax=Hibiscus syriacus TaxID=106335 RepID=A0A6A2WB31_HIBSY|nr:Endoplasmic reticulum oxidoreductin-1 [Hibiscus syriacus]
MKWRWVIGAFTTILIVIALASRSTPMISFKFGHIISKSSCHCPQEHRYSGIVEDCCCDYETVDHLNEEVLHPLLQELVKIPFFRYFKVKLWCNCPFWPDDGMCRLRDCSVCECPESEFPESFKKPYHHGLPSDDLKCQEGKPEATVDRTLDSKAFRALTFSVSFARFYVLNALKLIAFVFGIDIAKLMLHIQLTEMTYVNLQLNLERYTGYTGPSARRIWDAVYSENCPKYPAEELCQEEKLLYKLISGLHSSITIHIASDYLLDEAKNLWGHNLDLLYNRVLKYPNRLQNLYFTFLFVLRAVTKATDYLEQAEYNTGNPTEDLKTQSLMRQLLYNPKLQAACPLPFDEARLWKGQRGPELKQKIQAQFKNISALMDCVGCEKCRLWGKLQVLGLGTALKILFSVNGEEHLHQTLELQRNEVIALMNLLNRLSESLKFVHEMGAAAEKLNEGTIISPIRMKSLVQRMWASIVKT